MKYTQQDYDNFPVIDGIKQCPTGDYTEIKVFAKRCSFAEGCKVNGPFWSFVYPPTFKIEGKVLIPFMAYPYWKEKFDLVITDNVPNKEESKKIPKLLKRADLSSCDKIILNSWL